MADIKNPTESLGITFSKDNMLDWSEHYKKVRCDNVLHLKGKIREHGEDKGVFNNMRYCYVILVDGEDCGLTTTDENGNEVPAELYCAYLVPTIDSVPDSKIESMKDTYGWDDMTIDEARANFDECDLAQEGYAVSIGSVIIPAKDKWDDDVLNGMATAIETIDSMRGFYLDRVINGVGMKGWDFLEFALTDKEFSDFFFKH